MSSNLKQHYLPQFYLKHFSNEGRIEVFDVPLKKHYSSNITDVGCQRLFYDFDPILLKGFFETDSFDRDYIDSVIRSCVEDFFAPIINALDGLSSNAQYSEKLDVIYLNEQYMELIIQYIIIQYFRTPKFRMQFEEIAKLLKASMSEGPIYINMDLDFWTKLNHNIFIYIAISTLLPQNSFHLKDYIKVAYKDVVNEINLFRNKLVSCGRVVCISKSNHKYFFTSDNPLCLYTYVKEVDEFYLAYFPLNKRLSILFVDTDHCPIEYKYINRDLRIITDDNTDLIDNLNLIETHRANQRIFSYNADFEKVRLFINGDIKVVLKV